MTPLKFDPKDPAEALVLGFDFAKLTSAPSAPAVTVARYSGEADDAPEAMLDGAATVQGTRVLQRIVGGVPGCTYSLRAECDGDGDGQHWVLAGLLEVKEAP